MIRGVHHISLATADLDKCLHFYGDLLGMTVKHVVTIEPGDPAFEKVVGMNARRAKAAVLNLGNLFMEIFCYEHPVPRGGERRPACDVGIRHIAFDVTDIHAEFERLKAAGVQSVSEPIFLPAGKCTSVYLYDPDGNICELQEIHAGSSIEAARSV